MNKVKVYDGGHGSLVVSLTKFLKRIGIKRGDELYVIVGRNKIILSKDLFVGNEKLKPRLISNELWEDFEKSLIILYGKDGLKEEVVKDKLEEAIKSWIKKKRSILEKPIIHW